jgi:hypothetical protein
MRTRRRHRRHGEEEEEELEAARVATEPSPADRALDLQKTAGNHAVGAALARWAVPWVPRAPAPQWPTEEQVVFDGKAIPLLATSWGDRIGGGPSGPGKPEFHDVEVSVRVGTYSSELALASAEGRHFKEVVIVMPRGGTGVTITLTDVLIEGQRLSGDAQTLQLHFASYELSQSPPKP